MIERYELDAERGFATVPMNVGQELWDYVKVTDSRQGDTRIGNIQYLSSSVKIPLGNEAMTFSSALSFGKVSLLSIMSSLISAGGVGEVAARLTNEQILVLYDGLIDRLERLTNAHNSLVGRWNSFVTEGITIKKLTVTEQMIIPVWS